ncbi:MAG: phosphotransferase [Streptosporangiales bacterium]|nr:phosphotransferase [Streptosporangiales bacterium]
MEFETYTGRWAEPAWRAEVLAWATERLAEHGLSLTGEPEQPRMRPWSTMFVLPTDAGMYWLKANATAARYEAPLVDALARWAPEHVLTPLAVDAERGFVLNPDGGTILREADPPAGAWESMVAQYAELQLAVAPHAGELVGLGVPDALPAHVPARVDELLDRLRATLAPDTSAALRAFVPRLAETCARLDQSPVPPSIDIDDLHDGNVFVRPGGRHVFFDWGDAAVSHPFVAFLVAMRSFAHRYELRAGAPELHRLRDAYLEPFTDVAPVAELRPLVEDAARIATVTRAQAWLRSYQDTPTDIAVEGVGAAAEWLGLMLDPELVPLGQSS